MKFYNIRDALHVLRARAAAVAVLAALFGGGLFATTVSAQTNTHPLLSKWLEKQGALETWKADFTQTRTLKSFAQPFVENGQVWFKAPNQFRWELGQPAKTIAIRQPEQMLVIYPKLKRMEKYPLSGNQMGQWRDALSLLEAGFPRSQKELDAQFKITSIQEKNGVAELAMEPKSAGAKRMMPQIKLAFATDTFELRATELQFADGSIMRNDFRNPVVNEKMEPSLFAPELPPGFKVIEPMAQKR